MSSAHRLRRLRELLARIEQLPASPENERMLAEVRARVVDVDTGVTPRAMLPVDFVPKPQTPGSGATHAAKAVARPRADHRRGRPKRHPQEAVSGSAVGLSPAEDREWLALVAKNEVLSLDNSTPLSLEGEAPVGHDRRPWTRGLRG